MRLTHLSVIHHVARPTNPMKAAQESTTVAIPPGELMKPVEVTGAKVVVVVVTVTTAGVQVTGTW